LFVITGSVHTDSGRNLGLGTAAPLLTQFGFSAREGGTSPYSTHVSAEWTLSDTAIERIEKVRDDDGLTLYRAATSASIPDSA
jgi:hypothetical protein